MILDPCCGSRMFWFDKAQNGVIFGDLRCESHTLCDGRSLIIRPDVQMDFTHMPFAECQFEMVVFDPPHFSKAGTKGWQAIKYGKLPPDWRDYLSRGLSECLRVLEPRGILIFKWNETQIKVGEVLSLTDCKPLFGHKRNGLSKDTHWICFRKSGPEVEP